MTRASAVVACRAAGSRSRDACRGDTRVRRISAPDSAADAARLDRRLRARWPLTGVRAVPMPGEATMAKCEVCGNDYYLSFEVITAGQRHVFDSFECAIHKLAPVCDHCGCKIIGHGMEANGTFYCCAACARHKGATGVADHG
jgi:hypothetical protein